ncbi:MAG TPA: DNRLRE domain-containing protein [Bacillales bacterium]|nr:DNRLRE domain-containing protein [Bacillales bacterium]
MTVRSSYGLNRSLIRFALPPLPSNSQITKATFQAFQANTNIGNTAIDLHRITSSWNDFRDVEYAAVDFSHTRVKHRSRYFQCLLGMGYYQVITRLV